MSTSQQTVNNYGSLITGLLGILFIGLKLTGFIAWSWWWVLAPFWGGIAIVLAFLLIAAIVALGIAGFSR